MYCPKKEMDINRFEQVDIPKNVEYMARFGNVNPSSNYYSGDKVIRRPANTVEELERYAEEIEAARQ